MNDNGDELGGDGVMDEEPTEPDADDLENEAIVREQEDPSSPRDNI